MTRQLTDTDIQEIDEMYMRRKSYMLGKEQNDKRQGKDRRKAINSYVDPSMERRVHDRRKK